MKIVYGGNYFISYLVEVRFRWRDSDFLSAKLKRSQRDSIFYRGGPICQKFKFIVKNSPDKSYEII